MKTYFIKLIKDYNDKKTDRERIQFIINHKPLFAFRLDNDSTHVELNYEIVKKHFSYDELEEFEMNKLDDWFGWSKGVFTLLKTLGIPAEGV